MKIIKLCLLALFLTGAVYGATCAQNSTHKVVSGDAMWSVIKLEYQATDTVTLGLIPFVANASGIKDPNTIHVGDTIVLPCFGKKATKTFVPFMTTHPQAPEISEITSDYDELPNVEVVVDQPQILVATNVSLPEFVEEVLVAGVKSVENVLPIPEAENIQEVSEEQVQIPVQASLKQARAKPGRKGKNGSYQIERYMPVKAGESLGVTVGNFPASVSGPINDLGIVENREDTSVQVTLSDQGDVYKILAIFKTIPVDEMALAIDFNRGRGGEPLSITGEHLKDFTEVPIGKALKKVQSKEYKTLKAVFQEKPNWVSRKIWHPVRPYVSLGGQVTVALVTQNYVALGYIGTSVVRGKLENLVAKQKHKEDNPVFLANKIAEVEARLDQTQRQQQALVNVVLSLGQQLNNNQQQTVAVISGGN